MFLSEDIWYKSTKLWNLDRGRILFMFACKVYTNERVAGMLLFLNLVWKSKYYYILWNYICIFGIDIIYEKYYSITIQEISSSHIYPTGTCR